MGLCVRHVHDKFSSGEESNQLVHVDTLTGPKQTSTATRQLGRLGHALFMGKPMLAL
jgi:hypothetical protein